MITRRSFLNHLGVTVAGLTTTSVLNGCSYRLGSSFLKSDKGQPFVQADGFPTWDPVAYPTVLLSDQGTASSDRSRLAKFSVVDDLVLPKGIEYKVLTSWGDKVGSGANTFRVGYNCDYTGLLPIANTSDEYWLFVNFEYVSSRPWLQGYESVFGVPLSLRTPASSSGKIEIDGVVLDSNSVDLESPKFNNALTVERFKMLKQIAQKGLAEMGVAVFHVMRKADNHFEIIKDSPNHKRIGPFYSVNTNNEFTFSGPASEILPRPLGTMCNCSGGTTPWGTFLTCEENTQDQISDQITDDGLSIESQSPNFVVSKSDKNTELPSWVGGLAQGSPYKLDGRSYGWVAEVDPVTGGMTKHTLLGRFRHENISIRCEVGRPLACYMGDDRTGGHVWKFVSKKTVSKVKDPKNSRLFRDGTLYVARFNKNKTGEWVPIRLDTPLVYPTPEVTETGHIVLPKRPDGGFVSVGTLKSSYREITASEWVKSIESYTNKKFKDCVLGDLVDTERFEKLGTSSREQVAQLILQMDAFVMANAVGATPSARPEDLEIHPIDKSVYVAFTDHDGKSAGAPSRDIFKGSPGNPETSYGSIFRIVETKNDPASISFSWGQFITTGEVGLGGSGTIHADNLAFDSDGNLWVVCDIATKKLNNSKASKDGDKSLKRRHPEVFGNNALFMIPTKGEHAGRPFCFATAPCEAELTGPTFTDDGKTLIISVQHPGEKHGTRSYPNTGLPGQEKILIQMHDRDGNIFVQEREVPIGSNFPHHIKGLAPRPSVVSIAIGKN